jgi:hypothetical protein
MYAINVNIQKHVTSAQHAQIGGNACINNKQSRIYSMERKANKVLLERQRSGR